MYSQTNVKKNALAIVRARAGAEVKRDGKVEEKLRVGRVLPEIDKKLLKVDIALPTDVQKRFAMDLGVYVIGGKVGQKRIEPHAALRPVHLSLGEGKYKKWVDGFRQILPDVSACRVLADLLGVDEVVELATSQVMTNGYPEWAIRRMRAELPVTPDLGLATFHEMGREEWTPLQELATHLPVSVAKLEELQAQMQRILRAETGSVEEGSLQAMLAALERTPGTDMGAPYTLAPGCTTGKWLVDEKATANAIADAEAWVLAARSMTQEVFLTHLRTVIRRTPENFSLKFKRKLDSYSTERVDGQPKYTKKIRPYYVVPVDHVLACQLMTDSLRHVICNYLESPGSVSAYRHTFMYGGVQKFVATLREGVDELLELGHGYQVAWRSVCFSDDSLGTVRLLREGQCVAELWLEYDASAFDMHCSRGALLLEKQLYLQAMQQAQWAEEEVNLFANLWELMASTCYGGMVFMGEKYKVAKLWGLNSGTVWTTPSGIVNHCLYMAQIRRAVQLEMVAAMRTQKEMTPEFVDAELKRTLERLPALLTKHGIRMVLKDNSVHVIARDGSQEDQVLGHFCGHEIHEKKSGEVYAVLPREKVLLSIIQPKHHEYVSEDTLMARVQRYFGLYVTSGFHYPEAAVALQYLYAQLRTALQDGTITEVYGEVDVNWEGLPDLIRELQTMPPTLPEPAAVARWQKGEGALYEEGPEGEVLGEEQGAEEEDLVVDPATFIQGVIPPGAEGFVRQQALAPSMAVDVKKMNKPNARTLGQDKEKKEAKEEKDKAREERLVRKAQLTKSRKTRLEQMGQLTGNEDYDSEWHEPLTQEEADFLAEEKGSDSEAEDDGLDAFEQVADAPAEMLRVANVHGPAPKERKQPPKFSKYRPVKK